MQSELTISITNTLLVIGASLIVAVPLGVWLALVLFRTNVIGRRLAWVALGSQLAVPLYIFAGGWSAGFGLQGWISSFAGELPGLTLLSQVLGDGQPGTIGAAGTNGAIVAVAVIHGVAAIPWVTLLISIGLMWIDRAEEEQASLEGGAFNIARRVILPRLQGFLLVACLWCIVPILTEMVVSNLFQVPTVAEQVYLDASQGTVSPMTYVSGFSLCALPVCLLLGVAVWRSPKWEDVNFRSRHFSANVVSLRRRGLVSVTVWFLIFVLVGLPIANLIAKAGWQPFVDAEGLTQYGWSFERLMTTADESIRLFKPEFAWSGVLSSASSLIALGMAAVLFALTKGVLRFVCNAVMVVMIAVPGPLVGMIVIWLLNRSSPAFLGWLYDHTLTAPILAQQFRLLPLAWLLVWVVMSAISKQSWEQAKLDGFGRLQMLRVVVLPQTAGSWIAAWLLLFAVSVGELSCTILVLPPGVTTVSMRLFEMLHFGMRHQDSGLCCVLILLGWAISIILWAAQRSRDNAIES